MTLDGEVEIIGAHAATVVDDADQPPPARLDCDLDMARAGVERVLDKLLRGGGGPLDDLAGGDAVDEERVETADRHEHSARRSWPLL